MSFHAISVRKAWRCEPFMISNKSKQIELFFIIFFVSHGDFCFEFIMLTVPIMRFLCDGKSFVFILYEKLFQFLELFLWKAFFSLFMIVWAVLNFDSTIGLHDSCYAGVGNRLFSYLPCNNLMMGNPGETSKRYITFFYSSFYFWEYLHFTFVLRPHLV